MLSEGDTYGVRLRVVCISKAYEKARMITIDAIFDWFSIILDIPIE